MKLLTANERRLLGALLARGRATLHELATDLGTPPRGRGRLRYTLDALLSKGILQLGFVSTAQHGRQRLYSLAPVLESRRARR